MGFAIAIGSEPGPRDRRRRHRRPDRGPVRRVQVPGLRADRRLHPGHRAASWAPYGGRPDQAGLDSWSSCRSSPAWSSWSWACSAWAATSPGCPHSIVVGFTIGIAVTIALSQVGEMLGLSRPRSATSSSTRSGRSGRTSDEFNWLRAGPGGGHVPGHQVPAQGVGVHPRPADRPGGRHALVADRLGRDGAAAGQGQVRRDPQRPPGLHAARRLPCT